MTRFCLTEKARRPKIFAQETRFDEFTGANDCAELRHKSERISGKF